MNYMGACAINGINYIYRGRYINICLGITGICIVMELVEGTNLRKLIPKHNACKMPEPIIAAIAEKVTLTYQYHLFTH